MLKFRQSTGLVIASGHAEVDNNTFLGDIATLSRGIYLFDNSSAEIKNNKIYPATERPDTKPEELAALLKGAWSDGIHILNSTATVENNLILGGNGLNSAAILIESSDGLGSRGTYRRNKLDGGSGANQSFGILVKSYSGLYLDPLLIERNWIHGGRSSKKTTGVSCSQTNCQIQTNIIFAGSTSGASTDSTAVVLDRVFAKAGNAKLLQNTILAGPAIPLRTNGGKISIWGNIFNTSSEYCVGLNDLGTHHWDRNVFSGCNSDYFSSSEVSADLPDSLGTTGNFEGADNFHSTVTFKKFSLSGYPQSVFELSDSRKYDWHLANTVAQEILRSLLNFGLLEDFSGDSIEANTIGAFEDPQSREDARCSNYPEECAFEEGTSID